MKNEDNGQEKLPENVHLIINKQIVPLKEITLLGRGMGNDVVIHEDFISRKHAEIRFENNQFVVYDLNSTSGTFINNKRVQRCVLCSGDIITLATYVIMFVDNNTRLQDLLEINTRSLDLETRTLDLETLSTYEK